jgi:hypothetical protein
MRGFLQRFAKLGAINGNLQRVLTAFFQWKKQQPRKRMEPDLFEFFAVQPLREAEELFYQVGLTPEDGLDVIDKHVDRLEQFARWIITHVHASVSGDPSVLTNGPFIRSVSIRNTPVDPEAMCEAVLKNKEDGPPYQWNLIPTLLANHIVPRSSSTHHLPPAPEPVRL